MSRIGTWLDYQRKIVEVDATHTELIVLEGPDGKWWGRWPIKLEQLELAIEGALQGLQDELPAGRHACRLLALDNDGNQVSMQPRTLIGKSSGATTAASEQKAMAQATAQAIRNNEEQTIGLRNENERLRERLAEELETKILLADKLWEISNANLDAEIRRDESEKKMELWKFMIEKAGPGIEVLGGVFAEKGLELFSILEEEVTTRARKVAEQRAARKEAALREEQADKQLEARNGERAKEGNGKPAHGNDSNGAHEPGGVQAHGEGGS